MKENVRFAVFQDAATIVETEPTGQVRRRSRAAVHGEELVNAVGDPDAETDVGHVAHGVGAVVDDVEIEQAVAVNIGQGHRHAAALADQSGWFGCFLKMSLAVV